MSDNHNSSLLSSAFRIRPESASNSESQRSSPSSLPVSAEGVGVADATVEDVGVTYVTGVTGVTVTGVNVGVGLDNADEEERSLRSESAHQPCLDELGLELGVGVGVAVKPDDSVEADILSISQSAHQLCFVLVVEVVLGVGSEFRAGAGVVVVITFALEYSVASGVGEGVADELGLGSSEEEILPKASCLLSNGKKLSYRLWRPMSAKYFER